MSVNFRILLDREFDRVYARNAGFMDHILLIMHGKNLAGSYTPDIDEIIIRASQGMESMLEVVDHEFIHRAIYLAGESSAKYDNISGEMGLP